MRLSLLTLIILLFSASALPAQPEGIPLDKPLHLGCGIYSMTGTAMLNKTGDVILGLHHNSTSPIEFILLVDNPEEFLKSASTSITVEGYVPSPISGNNRPFVILRKYVKNLKQDEGILKVREATCHDKREAKP